ncbi:amidohydrolase [Halobacillus andaensis]|uniref:amidohydrolase n=1 Tax=Halobacillus andaensis TaxID=1176239 RepID=UPI003D75B8C4
MILENVRIYQAYGNEKPEQTYAVEFEGERFKAIHPSPYSGDQEVIDGKGYVLCPGFIDSHMHLLRYGLLKKELDLTEATSFTEMKNLIEKHYKDLNEGGWFFGKGFNDSQFSDIEHLLIAEDLNKIQANAYIYLLHEDGHECVISEKAMDLLKQEEAFNREPEEFKETDSNGNWTGRFKDTAVHYINHRFWGRSTEDAKQALIAAFPHLCEHGITSVHTDDRSFIGDYERLWEAYTELEAEGQLPLDVQLHHYVFDIEDLTEFLNTNNLRTGDGTDQVTVGAVKIFLDGTQRLHTAAMRNPYPENPEVSGSLIYTQKQLNEMVALAGEKNMQVAMHAIGDRAVEQAIEALEQEEANTTALRHRIIHAQTLAPDLINRLQKLKPYIETQPSFLLGEWDKKDKWTPDHLLRFCDPLNSLVRANIPVTLSSDLPIGSINPLISVYSAITRMDLNHQPEGGWMPQERLSVDDSFNSFTLTPSRLEFREKEKGKIAPGYQADFVLLNKHPLEVKPEQIHQIQIQQTWQRGKRTFKK